MGRNLAVIALLLIALVARSVAVVSYLHQATPENQVVGGQVAEAAELDIEPVDFAVLFLGNSHSRAPGMVPQIEAWLAEDHPEGRVIAFNGHGPFLEDIARNHRILGVIDDHPSDVVFLQAQKYSQSQSREYPIDGAVELSERAERRGARVILFPEWAQADLPEEGDYIVSIYLKVADATGATMASVPAAWGLALKEMPDLILHAADGNHANGTGAYLTAAVLYGLISGNDPAEKGEGADPLGYSETRRRLRELASVALEDSDGPTTATSRPARDE